MPSHAVPCHATPSHGLLSPNILPVPTLLLQEMAAYEPFIMGMLTNFDARE